MGKLFKRTPPTGENLSKKGMASIFNFTNSLKRCDKCAHHSVRHLDTFLPPRKQLMTEHRPRKFSLRLSP